MPEAENASRETVLYSFRGYPYDGANPLSGLTYFKGTLYGATEVGGSGTCYQGCGTVYRVTTSGQEKVLHSFKGAKDGADPYARLIVRNGTLYGTTNLQGGCQFCGTVFSITPSGHETVLHGFAGSPDGQGPQAALRNVNGTLYGTTNRGGSFCPSGAGCGTVFSLTPGGKEKVLHSFGNFPDGAYPGGDPVDINGTLYATTSAGGAYNGGTVFSITLGGKEKVLYNFRGGNDPVDPSGLVDVSSTLYGTSYVGGDIGCNSERIGCGTVFSITPSGTEKVLYSFIGGVDGAEPTAALLNVNGTLYGTTANGGAYNGGTVFRITLSGHETVLYSFKGGQDGSHPWSGLSYVNGTLYGTTAGGGAYHSGTVFSIKL
jgi:uncharacterized repeat protein (TIGR03803 family)